MLLCALNYSWRMPKQQTSFDSEWQKDDRFSAWIARSSTSDSDAYCVLCKKSFSVANGACTRFFNINKVQSILP